MICPFVLCLNLSFLLFAMFWNCSVIPIIRPEKTSLNSRLAGIVSLLEYRINLKYNLKSNDVCVVNYVFFTALNRSPFLLPAFISTFLHFFCTKMIDIHYFCNSFYTQLIVISSFCIFSTFLYFFLYSNDQCSFFPNLFLHSNDPYFSFLHVFLHFCISSYI